MKKSQQGFSAVEMILAVVVIGLTSVVGWLVYEKQQIQRNSVDGNLHEQQNEINAETKTASYQLPDGWVETACDSIDSKAMLASPEVDIAVDCDDRTNVVLVSFHDSGKGSCLTPSQVEEIRKDKPISGYVCEELEIDGIKVLKKTGDYGGGPVISYSFQNMPLIISYFSNANGELVGASAADSLAKSVKFTAGE